MSTSISLAEDMAKLMITTFQRGLNEGVEHHHPKTNKLLLTVKEIIEVFTEEGEIHLKFPGEDNDGGN